MVKELQSSETVGKKLSRKIDMSWTKHLMYIVIIITLQLINFHAVGYTKHKSDWCEMFYEQYREGL